MKLEIILEKEFNIDSPYSLFAGDADSNILELVRKHYNNICYAGVLITNVKKILERSDCYMIQSGEPNFGILGLRFLADCIRYFPGELIPKCIVKKRDKQQIILNGPGIIILTEANTINESLKVGQEVPIVLTSISAAIGDTFISAYGELFTKISASPSYLINKSFQISKEAAANAKSLSERLKKLESRDIFKRIRKSMLKKIDTMHKSVDILKWIAVEGKNAKPSDAKHGDAKPSDAKHGDAKPNEYVFLTPQLFDFALTEKKDHEINPEDKNLIFQFNSNINISGFDCILDYFENYISAFEAMDTLPQNILMIMEL